MESIKGSQALYIEKNKEKVVLMKKVGFKLLVLMLTMSVLLVGCSGGDKEETATGSASKISTAKNSPESEKAPETLNLKVYQPFFGEKPARGLTIDKLWQEKMEAYLGVKLNITWDELPYGDYLEKMPVYLASGDYADVFLINSMDAITEAGTNGAILNLKDKLDLMPNYKKFLDANGGQEMKKVVSGDGNLYMFADGARSSTSGTQWSWIYRFDTFQKHNMAIPTNLDEFYSAAKQLKQLYPDSYPVTSGVTADWYSIDRTFAYLNRTSPDVYFNGKSYVYGPVDEQNRHKEVLAYLHKLFSEGLLDPEFYTQTGDQFSEKMLTGKTFIVPNTFTGFKLNNLNVEYPQTWGLAHRPVNFHGEIGWKLGSYIEGMTLNVANGGAVISSKAANPDLLIRMMDYQYSPEMLDLLNWGIEGETFTKSGDVNSYTDVILSAANPSEKMAEYGINLSYSVRSGVQWVPQDIDGADNTHLLQPVYENGEYGKAQIFAFTSGEGPESSFPQDIALPVTLTKEENDLKTSIMTPLDTFRQAETIKFIIGSRSLDTWDAYIEELKKLGDFEAVKKIYNDKS